MYIKVNNKGIYWGPKWGFWVYGKIKVLSVKKVKTQILQLVETEENHNQFTSVKIVFLRVTKGKLSLFNLSNKLS